MTLDEIPVIVVNLTTGIDKFVVALLKHGEHTKTILRTGHYYRFHKNIMAALGKELQGSEIEAICLGGGRIKINVDEKTIFIDDCSADYGYEPNRQETVRLIQVAHPDFKVAER